MKFKEKTAQTAQVSGEDEKLCRVRTSLPVGTRPNRSHPDPNMGAMEQN